MNWKLKSSVLSRTEYHLRHRSYYAVYQENSTDQNHPYRIESNGPDGGIILQVNNNYPNNGVDPKERCEYILRCLSAGLPWGLTAVEQVTAFFDPSKILPTPTRTIVEGVAINGIYKHVKTGNLYRVTSVSNIGCVRAADDVEWKTTVVYRDVFTDKVYNRYIENFLSEKYVRVN
ncbi:MAG: hypothetical protein [Bacteriophage sp.]|nr:MAG: hypothetical protein [Bacteriophage sp.]